MKMQVVRLFYLNTDFFFGFFLLYFNVSYLISTASILKHVCRIYDDILRHATPQDINISDNILFQKLLLS